MCTPTRLAGLACVCCALEMAGPSSFTRCRQAVHSDGPYPSVTSIPLCPSHLLSLLGGRRAKRASLTEPFGLAEPRLH